LFISDRGDSLFGAPLTQEGIAACQQLIDFMMKDDGWFLLF
jgi:hypothetical protein